MKNSAKLFGTLLLLCVAAGIVLTVSAFFRPGFTVPQCAMAALLLCSLAFVLIYGLRGGKKQDAGFYHGFRWTYLAALVACIGTAFAEYLGGAQVAKVLLAYIFSFLAVLVLNLVKDPGKLISYCLCVFNFLNSLLVPAAAVVEQTPQLISVELQWVVTILSLVLAFATVRKYADKAARGREV